MERHAEIERSIIKKYKKTVWNRFISAINEYELLHEGDRVAVCISGGKDSMLLAKCMQHLQKYSRFPFEVEYIVMDPGYNPANRQRIIDNAGILDIPIKIFESDIFNFVSKQEDSPCYLCARMRRGYLYEEAQKLGCNKIALGHHFDDVIETILMSMLYSAEIKTMMPKLKSTGHPGMELIRPLYMVRERDVISWARYNNLEFIRCACRFTEQCETADFESVSKRKEVKELIFKLEKENKHVPMNIFKSIHNVNLSNVIAHRDCDGGELKSFLERY